MRSIGEWEDATVPWKQMVVAIGLVVLIGMMGSLGSLPTRAQQATPVAAVSPTIAPIQSPRPRVFIASSVEGLPIAEAIALDMQFVADVTIWDQGVFPVSEGTLPALDAVADQSDFAVVVLTADDMTTKRGQTYPVPRDNVLFELGFFMGRLGVERTYMVYSRDRPPTLPSDLAGITPATFAERADGNLAAAIGPASTQIRQAMQAVMAAETDVGEPQEPLEPAA
jgi:predicted nucleotide-binding protein